MAAQSELGLTCVGSQPSPLESASQEGSTSAFSLPFEVTQGLQAGFSLGS